MHHQEAAVRLCDQLQAQDGRTTHFGSVGRDDQSRLRIRGRFKCTPFIIGSQCLTAVESGEGRNSKQATRLFVLFLGRPPARGLFCEQPGLARPAADAEGLPAARVGHRLLQHALWLDQAVASEPVFSEIPPFRVSQKQTPAGRRGARRLVGGAGGEGNQPGVLRVHL